MNSSDPVERQQQMPPNRVRWFLSHWVELLIIPISAAVMETQPILLILYLITSSQDNFMSIVPHSLAITTVLVALQWWGVWVLYQAERAKQREDLPLSLLGIVIGLLLMAAMQFWALRNPITVFLSFLVVGWAWFRGYIRALRPLSDDYITMAFRIGFGILLGIMILTINSEVLSDFFLQELSRSLPIFFLSGIIALSFTRLCVVRLEQERNLGSQPSETSVHWLGGFALFAIILVGLSLTIQSLPMEILAAFLAPIGQVLLWIGEFLLYLIAMIIYGFQFIISGLLTFFVNLFGWQPIETQAPYLPPQPPPLEPEIPDQIPEGEGINSATLLFIALIALFVIAGLLFYLIKRRPKHVTTVSHEEEEIRENLDRNVIIAERHQKKPQVVVESLEELDPESVRASYRKFLQVIASNDDLLRRRSQETPLEYQQRLLSTIQRHPLLKDPEDQQFLVALTHAYIDERYGTHMLTSLERSTIHNQLNYLQQKLLQRQSEIKGHSKSVWSATKARWGED